MFPIDFPLKVLKKRAKKGEWVLDPFCGRGTTNFASRLLGINSLGIDSNPVAAAITSSKLVSTSHDEIIQEAKNILKQYRANNIPGGEFWKWAFHPDVLYSLCCFREAFLYDCSTASRIALRGIILGALHGPVQKTVQSYFSNQSPRTYAPKPVYALKYWKTHDLLPKPVDILSIISNRATRFYVNLPRVESNVLLGDSREFSIFQKNGNHALFDWVITSPPYYGMRTYVQDQWLRNWFLGGMDRVEYKTEGQLLHFSPKIFISDLQRVWQNTSLVCKNNTRMVIRFGGIPYKKANSLDLLHSSLKNSGWKIIEIHHAGSANKGRRQANSFLCTKSNPLLEYDIYAIKK